MISVMIQVYSDKRGSAQAEYRAAMMTWMQEMIARGREDVIQDPAAQKILKDEIRTVGGFQTLKLKKIKKSSFRFIFNKFQNKYIIVTF